MTPTQPATRQAGEPPPSMMGPAPCGDTRAIGGLLGVAGGEAWQGARGGFDADEDGLVVTAAMGDLCRGYLKQHRPPVDVPEQDPAVPAPGWLLPAALVHRHKRDVISDTVELAIASGVPRAALGSCVAYTELAFGLFCGQPAPDAVKAATSEALTVDAGPPLLHGLAAVDGLAAGIWALAQPGRMCDVVTSLATYCEPWVAAAAAGLLGLRDGCAAVPANWHRCVAAADDCRTWGPDLAALRFTRDGLAATGKPPCLVVAS